MGNKIIKQVKIVAFKFFACRQFWAIKTIELFKSKVAGNLVAGCVLD